MNWKKLINVSVVLFLLLGSSATLARDGKSFFRLFKKQARKKGTKIPSDVNKKAFEFVTIIKKGETITFKMGSESKKAGKDEKPVHDVTLEEPFKMQRTEVTQFQWALIMGSNPSDFQEGGAKFSIDGKDVSILYNRPIEKVSYDKIQKFIEKLNKLDSKYEYRLPTEAEWEYAARGGSTTDYIFGDDAGKLGDYAWYYDNSGGRTHDVALKELNQYRLYDTAGNVWEWVSDWYKKDYYKDLKEESEKTGKPVTNPKGPNSGCSYRVMRGGCWSYDGVAWYCRSARRSHWVPGGHGNDVGFRLVRTVK